MSILIIIFWLSLFIVVYSYIGYGILIFCIIKCKSFFLRKKISPAILFQPPVALIIPAYNEEDFISIKIKNTLELEYPSDKLKIIFITDGSTDKTPEIIGRYPNVTLLHQPERKGKTAAMNRAIQCVKEEPVVIFSDANTLLNK